jgi:hypothetical protein
MYVDKHQSYVNIVGYNGNFVVCNKVLFRGDFLRVISGVILIATVFVAFW